MPAAAFDLGEKVFGGFKRFGGVAVAGEEAGQGVSRDAFVFDDHDCCIVLRHPAQHNRVHFCKFFEGSARWVPCGVRHVFDLTGLADVLPIAD